MMTMTKSVTIPPDLPPHEKALYIEHIHEKIFNPLQIKDLLNCRLVCHQWLHFVQNILERKTLIRFHSIIPLISEYQPSNWDKCKQFFVEIICRQQHISTRDTPKLCKVDTVTCSVYQHAIDYTKNTVKLMKLLKRKRGRFWDSHSTRHIAFPCTRFEFLKVDLNFYFLNNFLNANGKNIREMKLDFYDIKQLTNIMMVDQLYTLLTNQVQNLEKLILSAVTTNALREDNSVGLNFLESDEIREKTKSLLQQSTKRSSLKILGLYGKRWSVFFDFFIQVCPKLEDMFLFGVDYKILIEPVNRLYLLHQIEIDCCNLYCLETLEKLSRENFKIEFLKLHLHKYREWSYVLSGEERRMREVVERILEGSWDTLKFVKIIGFACMPDLKWPNVMPKVQQITICNSGGIEECRYMRFSEEATVFTQEFISKTFPNLYRLSLLIYSSYYGERIINNFLNMLRCDLVDADPVSTTVKEVILDENYHGSYDSLTKTRVVPYGIIKRIKELFPNAEIGFNYSDPMQKNNWEHK